jgi:hypothetical protein
MYQLPYRRILKFNPNIFLAYEKTRNVKGAEMLNKEASE